MTVIQLFDPQISDPLSGENIVYEEWESQVIVCYASGHAAAFSSQSSVWQLCILSEVYHLNKYEIAGISMHVICSP